MWHVGQVSSQACTFMSGSIYYISMDDWRTNDSKLKKKIKKKKKTNGLRKTRIYLFF